jgi:hypothetical protein
MNTRLKDIHSLLDESDVRGRLVRLETLVDLHLEKGGTVDRLEERFDGMKTKILLFSGACEGGLQIIQMLFRMMK